MEPEFVWAFVAVGHLCFLGFLAGLARTRFRLAPVIAGWVIAIGYVILLSVTGVWTAACPGCESSQSYDSTPTRRFDLLLAFLWGTLFAAGIIMVTFLGVGVSALFARLRRPKA